MTQHTQSERQRAFQLLQEDLPTFAKHCLKIRDKRGQIIPLVFNRAQMYAHNFFEKQKKELGFVRALILKGRQQGMCLDPDTKVLTKSLRWIKLKHIRVGKELVAVDEQHGRGRGATRKLRLSVVQAKVELTALVFKITTKNGVVLKATGNHRFLTRRRGGTDTLWRQVKNFRAGDELKYITDVWGSTSVEDGWFGGILDGEGSMALKHEKGAEVNVAQVGGLVWDRITRYLKLRGYNYQHQIDSRKAGVSSKLGSRVVNKACISRMSELFRLLGQTRPSRFVNRDWWIGKALPGRKLGNSWVKIKSIEQLPQQKVIDLQTSTKTFIAEGFVSHNSTYVAARYFHRTLLGKGTTTFILSHESKSTATLFDMVKRYHDHLPGGMSPGLDTSNKNQLKFEGTESEYTVGTAGNEDIGRSMTNKQLHMSEVAFYDRTDELETGLMQTVADMPDTEVILESTANGLGNMFHERTMKALAGVSLDRLLFIPWYWQLEYRLSPPDGFEPDEYEHMLIKTYGLDLEQIYWRRMKIASTKGGLWKFQQEYPFTPDEAFLMSGETFYSKEFIVAAKNCHTTSPGAPVILGIDCGRNNDRSVFTLRQGRAIIHYEVHKDLRAEGQEPTQQLISIAVKLIERFNVKKCFIDYGYGHGVIDGLKTLGYNRIVMGVHFKQTPLDEARFLNKRAEMHGLARDWLEEGEVNIPNDDIFSFDLLLIPKEKETPTHRMFLPLKIDIKKVCKVSPDINDSFILTFAFPVAWNRNEDSGLYLPNRQAKRAARRTSVSPLSTINRMRQKH